jgi:hypothetical protein
MYENDTLLYNSGVNMKRIRQFLSKFNAYERGWDEGFEVGYTLAERRIRYEERKRIEGILRGYKPIMADPNIREFRSYVIKELDLKSQEPVEVSIEGL